MKTDYISIEILFTYFMKNKYFNFFEFEYNWVVKFHFKKLELKHIKSRGYQFYSSRSTWRILTLKRIKIKAFWGVWKVLLVKGSDIEFHSSPLYLFPFHFSYLPSVEQRKSQQIEILHIFSACKIPRINYTSFHSSYVLAHLDVCQYEFNSLYWSEMLEGKEHRWAVMKNVKYQFHLFTSLSRRRGVIHSNKWYVKKAERSFYVKLYFTK